MPETARRNSSKIIESKSDNPLASSVLFSDHFHWFGWFYLFFVFSDATGFWLRIWKVEQESVAFRWCWGKEAFFSAGYFFMMQLQPCREHILRISDQSATEKQVGTLCTRWIKPQGQGEKLNELVTFANP